MDEFETDVESLLEEMRKEMRKEAIDQALEDPQKTGVIPTREKLDGFLKDIGHGKLIEVPDPDITKIDDIVPTIGLSHEGVKEILEVLAIEKFAKSLMNDAERESNFVPLRVSRQGRVQKPSRKKKEKSA